MRRILIFSLVYYPRFIGGAEVAVKEVTDRISGREFEFDMITLSKQFSPPERVGNVNMYGVGQRWFGGNTKSSKIFPLSKLMFIPLAFIKAIRLHHKQKYDIIWPIMASYAGFSALLFKIFFPAVPMVLTIQEGDNFERREGIFRCFFKKIFMKADYIQAISGFLADWSRKMGAKCPITVVPNGVDYDSFSMQISPDARRHVRSECGFSDNDIVIVTASRLVYKNAVDDIVASLQYLSPEYKLLILGTGPDESMLRSQCSSLKLGQRVVFGGFVPHSELPGYLQASDVFVRPSRSEGLGNSFLEAMAAGIPVVATKVGGIPDFLKDGETGLFSEVNNPKSVAQKVGKLMKDKESRDYVVNNARNMVREKYQWEKVAGEMKKVFGETLN
jgi:glycosyltransferase involved in cell wall biosynthesis